MREAKQLYDLGLREDAKVHLDAILKENPNDLYALALYAKILSSTGNRTDLETAFTMQQRVLELEQSYREASHLAMAQILTSLGRSNEATASFRRVLEENPEHAGALGMLARLKINEGELRIARDLIEARGALPRQSSKPDPNYLSMSAEVWFKLGNTDMALRRANELINSFRPRRGQSRVPKAFITGLLIKAKILVIDPSRTNEVHRLLNEAESYLGFYSWFAILRAEAYYREGNIIESRKTLINILNQSKHLDLDVIAALVKIDRSSHSEGDLLSELFKHLEPNQVVEVMDRSKNLDWEVNVEGTPMTQSPYSLRNSFWDSLHTIPVNLQAIGLVRQ